jgi:hypothetical protein
MNITKSLTLYTAAVGGAWLGSTLYASQNTYIPRTKYGVGWVVVTFFGGLSGLVLTNKYCPCVSGNR